MGSPVDDALDRLEEALKWCSASDHAVDGGYHGTVGIEALATVRQRLAEQDAELERLREERAKTAEQGRVAAKRYSEEAERRMVAEAENRRLTEGLRAISAEASTGIRAENRLPFLTHIGVIAETTLAGDPERHARALLSASPSDGGGA